MNSRRNLNRWARVTLLLALSSLATMGFTVVDRGSRGATISADLTCELLPELDLSYIPQDLESRICPDPLGDVAESNLVATTANLGAVAIVDSAAAFEQYMAALEQAELIWNERYLAAMESTISFQQYSAALEQTELLWNQVYLSRFRSRPDSMMERAFVTEEYNAAFLWGVSNEAWTGKYGGDWFDVYGNATGLLELELADPQFANP